MSLPAAEIPNTLTSGTIWSTRTITFSIPKAGSTWNGYSGPEPTNSNFGYLTSAQAAMFRTAIQLWDRLISKTIEETDDLTTQGQIRVAFTDTQVLGSTNSAAYTYTLRSAPPMNGDIWLDETLKPGDFSVGSFGFEALVHEIGHALGLKHPNEGTGASLLAAGYDSLRYTVMSYNNIGAKIDWYIDPTTNKLAYTSVAVMPTTPMIFDILTIQQMYGASADESSANDTYTFLESSPTLKAIYDSGGVDTIDLSSHTRASSINLEPYSLSSIDIYPVAQQVQDTAARIPGYAWNAASFSGAFTWENNLGIAANTIIENVLCGSGADTILGNVADNQISGGDGDDSVSAGAGNDTISGGGGRNYLRGDDGNDSIVGGAGFDDINGNQGDDTCVSGGGDDWVVGGKGNDSLVGSAGQNLVYGNLGNDTCDGGAGNDIVRGGQDNDSLMGGAGDDFVSGDKGDDTVSGGAGADVFHTFGDAGIDRVLDFNLGQGDRVQLDPGTQYTVSQVGADTVIDMTGGGKMILVGVSMSSLTGAWIFGA